MYVLTPYEVLRRNGADVQKGKAYRWVESSEAGEAKKAVEGSPSGPEWAELPHEFGGSRLPLGRVAAGGQILEAVAEPTWRRTSGLRTGRGWGLRTR